MSRIGWLLQDAADVPASEGWMGVAEVAEFRALRSEKRRGDWRVGHWTAKRAIAAWLGGDEGALGAIEIRHDPEGAPSAHRRGEALPLGVSISHRDGRALAAVSPADAGPGCDLELAEPRSRAFVAQFLTEGERRLVARASSDDLPTLLWSAKESALKALGIGLRVDARALEVSLPAGAAREGWRALEVRERDTGRVFPGWWRREGRWLLTLATLRPTPPPMPASANLFFVPQSRS